MRDVGHDIAPERRTPDRLVAELATRQHGVVARHQLLELGLGPGAIKHRASEGRLHAVHRGVYSVGHKLVTLRGRWMAAVLACGPRALLSHRDAAALWGLASAAAGPIDVLCSGRSRARIRAYRSRTLHPEERAICDAIPVTSVARTLVDLAGTVNERRLSYAIERSEQLGFFDLTALKRTCDRNRGRRGVRAIRDMLARYEAPPGTRSPLERRFYDFCKRTGLPLPAVNAVVAGLTVDALWQASRLIVELDSFRFHRSRASFEEDRKRDGLLALQGYRVLRFTTRRLDHEPEAVAATIRALLPRAR